MPTPATNRLSVLIPGGVYDPGEEYSARGLLRSHAVITTHRSLNTEVFPFDLGPVVSLA